MPVDDMAPSVARALAGMVLICTIYSLANTGRDEIVFFLHGTMDILKLKFNPSSAETGIFCDN